MPDIALTPGLLGRPRLDLPAVRAVNVYYEASDGGPSKSVRTSRPGLTQVYDLGIGPILRTFQKPGLFNSLPFNVSGGSLYLGSTLLGVVAYSSAPRFAAAQTYLALVVGGALYIYDGTTLTLIEFFDDGVSRLPPFSSVAVLYNIWVYTVVGSNQFFFSAVGNPGVINAANFSAAQVSPTPTVEVAALAEELYFFKTDTVEIWDFTDSLTAPFAESPGRTYSRGCAAQGSVSLLDNSLFWIGDDFSVYRTGTVPQRLTPTTSYVEDRLKAEANAGDIALVTAMSFNIEGHAFYVVNLPMLNESYAYDAQSKFWFQWGTQQPLQAEPGVWLPQTCSGQGDQVYLGSSVDGRVWLADETNHTDDGIPMRCVVGAARWIEENVERANNLSIQMVRGVATSNVPDPQIWMRWSEDGGRTWTSWTPGSLGPIGAYRWRASWHSLGLIRQPGREFEFAIMDAVNVTLESATINPGRR